MEVFTKKFIIHETDPYEKEWEQRELTEDDWVTINRTAEQGEFPEDTKKLFLEIQECVANIIGAYQETYPFLQPLGFSPGNDNPFDDVALKKIALAHRTRLKKNGRMDELTNPDSINFLMSNLTQELERVYKFHIEPYSGLFEDLDKQNFNQEVFLGRDAIYMYYARQAQLLARKDYKDSDLNKHVILLDYPIGFKYQLTPKESKEYLEDHGIVDVTSTIFIDTGYAGSVPEHILRKVFEIHNDDEINKRILLLKSHVNKRQSKRAEKWAGSVGIIESSPKPHQRSDGVTRVKETGRLKSFARPSTPEVAFMHDCIQFICMRHFYQKGLTQLPQKRQKRR